MAEELVWLDSADGALAQAGLALEAGRRGPPALLQSMPDPGQPWRPGTPPAPPRKRSGAPRADATPPELGPAPPVPLAAFTGRRSLLRLTATPGPIALTVLVGRLRAVTAERPVARVLLAGPVGPVVDLARSLVAELPLLPPRASLAEEGRALARGGEPRARRRGPPDPTTAHRHGPSVEAALETAIGHLTEVMLQVAPLCRLGTGPAGVHQMRVAARRLRSALRAFRPAARCGAVDAFDAEVKALATLLGPPRDLDVFLGGLGADLAAALPEDRRIAGLLRIAEVRRAAGYAALGQALAGVAFRRIALEAVALLALRPWRETAASEPAQAAALAEPLPAFAARLLDKRWRRLRQDAEDIRALPPEALHDLRLDAKRLRYGAELFVPLWPGKPARRFLNRLSTLQDALGVANDTAVARALVTRLGPGVAAWAIGVAEGFALARAAGARERAIDAWDEMQDAKPFWAG